MSFFLVLVLASQTRGKIVPHLSRPPTRFERLKWIEGVFPRTRPFSLDLPQQPVIAWRGVHLFVGPNALKFQTKLIKRVLKPLGFNYVVLECERTRWKSAPRMVGSDLMSTGDLARLFHLYRQNHIEPIPLIESFGHMKWLLGNKGYKELAIPNDPNTIDPLNPKARRLLTNIWSEAVHLLHPRVVHFGLDEVGLPLKPEVANSCWCNQLRTLERVANRLHVRPMFWGDEMLAPGEAPDSFAAPSTKDAIKRRACLPKGSLMGDWHYIADANPNAYKSLDLWKRSGQRPIASEWNSLANIVGFTLAAQRASAGTLLTTWAGYSSDETSMLANTDQFTAFVFASQANANPQATARMLELRGQELLKDELRAKFQNLYFGNSNQGGSGWTAQIFDLKVERGGALMINCSARGKAMLLDLFCLRNLPEGRPVAKVELTYADGTVQKEGLLAGIDVATRNHSTTFRAEAGTSRIPLRAIPLRAIEIYALVKAPLEVRRLAIAR